MFDDQTNNPAGSPPKNLPVEPDDIFAGVDGPSGASTVPTMPNALDAGILKKKVIPTPSAAAPTAPVSAPQPVSPLSAVNIKPSTDSAAPSAPSVYTMKEPILGKIILVIILGSVLGGLGFGGWWVYDYMQSGGQSKTVQPTNTLDVIEGPSAVEEVPLEVPLLTEPDNNAASQTPAVEEKKIDVPAQMNNDKILFGEPIDSDKDGLDDVREQELGTDPNKVDTDGDGLTDGEEILIWKTSPLKSDTDGDSYLDGDEVRHGYNPLGPGKLFNATSSASTSTKK